MKLHLQYQNLKHIFRERNVDGVPFLSFSLFESLSFIRHGFSTRLGGVSQGIYSSMNLTFGRDDEVAAVRENFKRMSHAIGVTMESMVFSRQMHTANVRVISAADCGKGITKAIDYDEVDGMVTNVPGVCLATFYADCVPLYFVDPVHRAIGLSHSGWRGSVGQIGRRTIERMQKEFGSDPDQILAAIGPSICQDCYEVSEDVIESFRESFAPKHWPTLFYQKPSGKYQLNLWKANECILLESGIQPQNIAVTNLCTCCNPDMLFSHRASKGKRGNLGAFLAIGKEE